MNILIGGAYNDMIENVMKQNAGVGFRVIDIKESKTGAI